MDRRNLKLCVTFGTPHLGAALAANQYRFMGAFASVTSTDQKMLSIYRLLSRILRIEAPNEPKMRYCCR